MKALYAILLLITITFPLLLSFDKKVAFYKQWKTVIPAILIVAGFYIIADIFLTNAGVWGFNEKYHSELKLFHLPVEEWFFFIFVPYACLFLHYVIMSYFPDFKLQLKTSRLLSIIIIVALLIVIVFNFSKTYTIYISVVSILALAWGLIRNSEVLAVFLLSFLVMLIPFLIMNSILTGSFIEQEVVWYNNEEILGIRLFTIPVEDTAYAFSLILLNLLTIESLNKFLVTKKQNNDIQ